MNNTVECSVWPSASITVEAQGEFVKITITGRGGEKQSVVLSDRQFSKFLNILDEHCGY